MERNVKLVQLRKNSPLAPEPLLLLPCHPGLSCTDAADCAHSGKVNGDTLVHISTCKRRATDHQQPRDASRGQHVKPANPSGELVLHASASLARTLHILLHTSMDTTVMHIPRPHPLTPRTHGGEHAGASGTTRLQCARSTALVPLAPILPYQPMQTSRQTMHNTPAPSADVPSHIDMVRCTASQLDLALADDAMQRVVAQWARLQAMASALTQEPLGIADEPAPVFTP
jgi:hypothetical protein